MSKENLTRKPPRVAFFTLATFATGQITNITGRKPHGPHEVFSMRQSAEIQGKREKREISSYTSRPHARPRIGRPRVCTRGGYAVFGFLLHKGILCHCHPVSIADSSPRSMTIPVPQTWRRQSGKGACKAIADALLLRLAAFVVRTKTSNTTMANGRWCCPAIGAGRFRHADSDATP